MVDIDGWSNCPTKEGKQAVTVLGGYLGQIMIILNAICREFSHLDKPTGGKYKSGGARASQDSRPKTPASEFSNPKSEGYDR